MKAFWTVELERLIGYSPEKLRAIITDASVGKRLRSWASEDAGVPVDAGLAKRIGVRTRDLEYLVDACWNAVAYHDYTDEADRSAYKRATRNLLERVGGESQERSVKALRWAERVEDFGQQEDASKLP